MPKVKIIVCCDGTSNSEYIKNNPLTNVSRISRCIPPEDNDGIRQLVYYHPGVGTDEGNPFKFWNQAVGKGIDQMIIGAYTFICQNYHAPAGDEIFLIGFSRGAFAVRCIADFVGMAGVLEKSELNRVHELYETWKRGRHAGQKPRRPVIKACAVWDTVSSIGVPLPSFMWQWDLRHVHSDVCHSIEHAFQALALHEHRYHFRPIVWQIPSNGRNQIESVTESSIISLSSISERLEQCWFSGYHADAGGGNERDALAHFALAWIMSKLRTWVQFYVEGFSPEGAPSSGGVFSSEEGSPLRPLNLGTSWAVGGDASERQMGRKSYRLRVPDPVGWSIMGLLYSVGGSRYRIPQEEFWGPNGPHKADPERTSYETVHATVQYLISHKVVKPCRSLAIPGEMSPICAWERWDLVPRESWGQWLWRLVSAAPRNNIAIEEKNIEEKKLDQWEKDLLKEWILYERREFHDMPHLAGERPPDYNLVRLQEWLN